MGWDEVVRDLWECMDTLQLGTQIWAKSKHSEDSENLRPARGCKSDMDYVDTKSVRDGETGSSSGNGV